MTRTYRYISADSHLEIDSKWWADRVPAVYRDPEQLAMLYALFIELGVERLDVVINNVGGPEDRPAYRAALIAYFEPHRAELCPDCQRRLDSAFCFNEQ